MGVRFEMAKAVGASLTWGLKNVFRRPAANTPGKIALYVDPSLIGHLAYKLRRGSVIVVGTNGKTTVTNLLADVAERAGMSVACNRTGANLDSGVSTSLLQSPSVDWGIFESDELWLAKILPFLQSDYVVLLNLFRDQLDRCGEIDRIQDSIVETLGKSPRTVLVYNADDPLCAMIAERAGQLPGRKDTPSIAFGVAEDMGLEQNLVADATMCQRCSSMFEYDFRQYGQLGAWHCPNCGFERPALGFRAVGVSVDARRGLDFSLEKTASPARSYHVHAPFSGAYMVYNLAAVATAAHLIGASGEALQQAIDEFDPQNGRLQAYTVEGRRTLLNLAKNPTGFNQNLKIVAQDEGPKAVAFFINDKEADGRDISWIWDIDFEELVGQENCRVFAGGIRRNDLQVRLKYAGVTARLVDGANDVFAALRDDDEMPGDAAVYVIANYTALPAVHSALDAACDKAGEAEGASADASAVQVPGDAGGASFAAPENVEAQPAPAASAAGAEGAEDTAAAEKPLVIAHMFPDLLNLYGDGGNVRILSQRCYWRGIPVEVKRVEYGEELDFDTVDLVFLGGGPDREQKLASEELMRMRDGIARYVESDGPLLAICGGYQILGRIWLLGGEEVPGLGVIETETRRPGTSADRLINNIVLKSTIAEHPVVGYENHAGRTYLDPDVLSFGAVVSSVGKGNNDADKADGVLYRKVIGTYLHGTLLSKNPEVADFLIAAALERRAARTGEPVLQLAELDDSEELAANAFMCKRLNVPFA